MSHKQGWRFCFVAGLIPFSVGLMGYITAFVMSILIWPEEPVRVLWKTCSFSQSSLYDFDPEAAAFLGVATLCFWQLLVVWGGMVMTLSYFAIRTGQRWAWYFILFAVLWGAGNDTIAALYLHFSRVISIPTPLFVDALGLLGLFLSRDILRSVEPRPGA
jgi:hypothetical protein